MKKIRLRVSVRRDGNIEHSAASVEWGERKPATYHDSNLDAHFSEPSSDRLQHGTCRHLEVAGDGHGIIRIHHTQPYT